MTHGQPIHLVFMLEEESAGHLLNVVLHKIPLPDGVSFQCVPHQGKSDLQKSIPRKLAAWEQPNSFFIILHDLDSNPDCIALKNDLRQLCEKAGNHTPMICIICQELEAWYFGDLDAVEKAFPRFKAARYRNKLCYRDPDSIVRPSNELRKIVKGFNKGKAARTVPKHMDINQNTSTSFKHFINGIRHLVTTQLNAQNR